MAVADVSEKEFDSEVLKSKVPVVIDLWAEWCGPCRMYSPIIEQVSEEYDKKVKFVKINIDENESLAQRYNVMSIPTTLLIEHGEVKTRNVGAVSKEILKSWLKKNL